MNKIYRPEIDGLRAVAVLGVIFYHSEFLSGGFLGVDIFFVISGYLITSLIYLEYKKNKKFSLLNFYQKRIRRLVPALLVVIFLTSFAAYSFLLPYHFKEYIYSVIYSFFFSSNIYFHFSGQAYGANILSIKPLLHTWSLGIEEQFYLFFPIFFILVAKFFFKKLNYFLIFIFLSSFIFSLLIENSHQSFNFYMISSRAWELIGGGILAIHHIKKKKKLNVNSNYQKIFTKIGLALIIFSFLMFKDAGSLRIYYTIIPVIGCCLIINYNYKNDLIIKILSSKPFVSIGLISYSLYLWHHPILSFDKILGISKGDIFIKINLILLSILLAYLTYKFVETPFRKQNFYSGKKLILTTFCLLPFFSIILFKSTMYQEKKFPNIAKKLHEKTWFKTKQYLKPCFQRKKYFCSFDSKKSKNTIMASIQEELRINLDNRDIKFIPMTRSAGNELEANKNRRNKILKNKNATIIFHFDSSLDYKELINFKETIIFFLDKSYKVILLYPIPKFNENTSEVLAEKIQQKNFDYEYNYLNILYKEYQNETKFIFSELNKINHKNLFKRYPHKIFCNTETLNKCISHNKKDIFFIDESHLSKKGSELINIDLIKIIDKIY